MLEPLDGRPLIAHALDAAAAWPVVVVASTAVAAVVEALPRADVRIVHNDAPERGMTHSLALADAAIPRDAPIAVLLADMPDCDASAIARVIAAYDVACDVVVPRAGDRFGHPVVFGPIARERIAALPEGDALHRLRDDPTLRRRIVDVPDARAFADIDTEADLRVRQTAEGRTSETGQTTGIEPDTTAPLRARITHLGRLVGDVLREYARQRTFELVERLRALTRARRSNPRDFDESELDRVLDDLDLHDAVDVIRAFGLYFQMVNLSEELHRERRRREHLFAGDPPMRGSLETLPDDALPLLERLEICLVFTAHPTEVARRTTLEKLLTIAQILREHDTRRLTAEEAAALDTELRAQMILMWQSNELYTTAPTVADEVRNLLARFR